MIGPWFRDHPILVFLALTFGITRSIRATSVLAPNWFYAQFGPLNGRAPLFYLMVWAPNIAAITVVSLTKGASGIWELFARLFCWSVRP